MLVADCECGKELVFEESIAGRINQCPACQKPIQVVAAPSPPSPSDAKEELVTHVCGCRKMLVADETLAGQMLRCPACDRMIGTYHDFGAEHWHNVTAAEAPPTVQPPTVLKTRPLVFKYERSGRIPMVCGLLMLVTLTLPWAGETAWSLLARFVDWLRNPSPQGQPADLPMLSFVVPAWGVGLLAVLAGLVLRKRALSAAATVLGLAAAALLARFLASEWTAAGEASSLRVRAEIVQGVAVALTIPFLVIVNVRTRVGPRPGMPAVLGILGAILLLACVAAVVASLQWFSTGLSLSEAAKEAWNTPGFTGFWRKAAVLAEYMLETPALSAVLFTLAAVLGLLAVAVWRSLKTFLFVTLLAVLAAIALAVSVILSAGTVGLSYVFLVGGTAALLLSGLTNLLAGALATPEDWQRA